MPRRLLVPLALLVLAGPAAAQKQFGFDNKKSSGQPYLTPAESLKRLTVPPEFEAKLFAGEPQVVNPVAFTVDERGRVWVLECFEYPSRTPKGKAPRDRIVILEDTDGDGACDKRTVFLEGKDFPVTPERAKQGRGAFDLATGLEVGHGKVYVGAPPYLWTVDITGDNKDKPGKITPVLSGFGSEDTHETLNTFQWGPDGWLYGMQGVFTQSSVKPLDGPETRMNAAVWRFHPVTHKFEIFAEGTSNPWGMDWRNTDGEFILACCVIPHLYHVVPGGIYKRQAGASYNPYSYGFINEISDHTFHKESGWAHAGLISLDVPHMPERFRNSVIFGSIHGCSLKQNVLKPNGSSYTASRGDDFLQSADKNFRPINMKWGPHGDIYLIDWHDQNPCHQAAADAWDYERGRVYRIQLKGRTGGKPADLAKLSVAQLSEPALDATNPWARRTALRRINETAWKQLKSDGSFEPSAEVGGALNAVIKRIDAATGGPTVFPLALLSTALQCNYEPGVGDKSGPVVAWWLRVMSDKRVGPKWAEKVYVPLAAHPSPAVRRELASFAGFVTPVESAALICHALMARKEDAADPLIPHLTWLAYEKVISKKTGAATPVEKELTWLADAASGNPFVRDSVIPKVMRRLVATGQPDDLARCLTFAGDLLAKDVAAGRKAVEGLALALDKQTVPPPAGWPALQAKLAASGDPALAALSGKLAVSFRDPKAAAEALRVAADDAADMLARVEAVRRLAALQAKGSHPVLMRVIVSGPEPVRVEAARALGAFAEPGAAKALLGKWKDTPPAVRAELVAVFAGRKEWAKELMQAMAAGTVARNEVTDNTVLKMQAFKDAPLDALIEKAWGRTRSTPAELLAVIDKMRGELNTGTASFTKGRAVFEANCAKCHKFEGKGQDVGPALDGAGRDIEYILANVIDPNRVVGAPYFLRTATTLDGRVEQGVLVEEDSKQVTLRVENGVLKRIAKADLDGPVKVTEKSMMPEGLATGMSTQDFRDLVRYLMASPYLQSGTRDGRLFGTPVTGRVPVAAGNDTLTFPVTAAGEVRTQLLLGVAGAYTVTLDGKQIAAGAGPGADPDRVSVPITVPAGKHTLGLAVKTAGGVVYARLLDPDRKLTTPEVSPPWEQVPPKK